VADFVVLVGAVVVGLTVRAVAVPAAASDGLVLEALGDDPDEDPVPDVVVVELAVALAEVVVAGDSFETINPTTAVAPAARTATDLDVRRTRVRASSRRRASWFDEDGMARMSPCEARDPRTAR
jgi:hypothetical protein